MKKTSRCEAPSHCLFLDTESLQEQINPTTKVHHLNFGYAAYVRNYGSDQWSKPQWQKFTKSEDLYAFIETNTKKKRKLYVFCHNTNFDLPITDVIGNMKKLGYKMTMAIIAGPPTIIRFTKDGKTVMFLDTLNHFRMSLAQLGKFINLEKYEDKDDTGQFIYDDKRCKRDVEIIVKAVQDWLHFISQNNLGGFAPTLAGQAMRAYRHRFMPDKILIDNDERALHVSREAYFGGRTEAFLLGAIQGPLFLLDIVSMYPSVMVNEEMPASLRTVWSKPTNEELVRLIADYAVTAHVILNTDEPVYPFRQNDRLTFPVGKYETFLTTPELRHALDHNHILSCKSVAVYNKAVIFKEFVEFFHEKRQECKRMGDEAGSMMHKAILNNLYGKTGQKSAPWVDEGQTEDLSAMHWTEIDVDTKTRTKFRQFGGLIQRNQKGGESRESHPAIAAHVTAYARMKLWKLIKTAGRDNVFYTDTDSLLVNHDGYTNLRAFINPNLLGHLSLDAEYETVEIFGAKDYRFGDKIKIKGIKKNAVKIAEAHFRQEQWSSLRGLIRTGEMINPTTKTIEKHLTREYKKGFVMPDGKIIPFLMQGEA